MNSYIRIEYLTTDNQIDTIILKGFLYFPDIESLGVFVILNF